MEKHIDRDGCKIAYESLPGSHGVTVILVHGYGLHRAMWEPQVEFLQQKGYPVINIDVRGHGNSRPTAQFSVKLAAEDIRAIVDAENCVGAQSSEVAENLVGAQSSEVAENCVGAQSPEGAQGPESTQKPQRYLLCGLSMGAFVVQEYGFLFGGAAGYMLTGVTPLCLPYPKWEKILLEYSGAIMKYLYPSKSLKKAMSKGSTYTEPALQRVSQMFEDIEKQEFLVSWAGFTTCLHEESFKFDAPLLVVAGEQDTRGTIQKHLPDWLPNYPGCELKTIPDAGHVANLDQPEQFNKTLLTFVHDCESAR